MYPVCLILIEILIYSSNITNMWKIILKCPLNPHLPRKPKAFSIYSSRNLPFASGGVKFEASDLLRSFDIWDLGGDVIWRIWRLFIKTAPSGPPILLAAEVVTGLNGEFLSTVGRQTLPPLQSEIKKQL